MTRSLYLSVATVCLLSSLLSACSGDDPEDVRDWMKTNSTNLKGNVPELPQIKPLPAITYDPGTLVSPFSAEKLFADDVKPTRPGMANGPKPINTDAYPLAKTPLDNIRLIGTMMIGKEMVAIVTSDRDAPRQIHIGDYIGQNFGKVTNIRPATDQGDGAVVVKEMVYEKGTWVERENQISQPIQGDKK